MKTSIKPTISLGLNNEELKELVSKREEISIEFNCLVYSQDEYELKISYKDDVMVLDFWTEEESEEDEGNEPKYIYKTVETEINHEEIEKSIKSFLIYVLNLS